MQADGTRPIERSILEEGLTTGLLGAGLVAAWFFVLDCVAGQPFLTPTVLGEVVFDRVPVAAVTAASAKTVFAYSGLHVILFLIVGWALAWMFRQFNEQPHFGTAYLFVFLMFEVTLFGVEISIIPGLIGVIGAWAVAVGNGLSAIGMFAFLRHRHPRSFARLIEAWHAR